MCSCSNVLMTGGVLIGLHRDVYWQASTREVY